MLDIHSLAERAANRSQPEKKEEVKKPVPNLKVQVLDFLIKEGPCFPVKIAQGVGRESFFVGAVLSELIESKKIKLSHAKVGGSKVYYIPGQEEQLSLLYNYLPEAEKNAYDLLKEKKVVMAHETTPVMRVALASIIDFSKPITVHGEKAWQWYLTNELPNEELSVEIKEPINELKKIIPQIKEPIAEIKKEVPKLQESQTKISQETTIVEKITPKLQKEDDFSTQVEDFFKKSNIKILEREVIRKNSESNFVIKIASQIGPLEMFVCAKNKKKISDQDLVLANQKGQNKKMPTLFITTGEQTKKSKDYLEKVLKGFMIFKKI